VKLATLKDAENSKKMDCCPDVKELQAAETSGMFLLVAETS